jgi:hypothetical protein
VQAHEKSIWTRYAGRQPTRWFDRLMRIRSIKPEFWRSNDITALSLEARLIFIGLWSYVDDNGVGIDDEKIIAADLFALEDDVATWRATVSRATRELAARALVTRYRVAGRAYLHITNWSKHQKIDKPSRGRYPLPAEAEPPGNIEEETTLGEPSPSPRDTLATVSLLEQGNRGAVEQGKELLRSAKPSTIDTAFNEFWSAYPKRVAKAAAKKRFEVLIRRGVNPDDLIAGARRYALERHGQDPQFTKQPDGWLNAGRWEDEPAPTATTKSRHQQETDDLFERAARRMGVAP